MSGPPIPASFESSCPTNRPPDRAPIRGRMAGCEEAQALRRTAWGDRVVARAEVRRRPRRPAHPGGSPPVRGGGPHAGVPGRGRGLREPARAGSRLRGGDRQAPPAHGRDRAGVGRVGGADARGGRRAFPRRLRALVHGAAPLAPRGRGDPRRGRGARDGRCAQAPGGSRGGDHRAREPRDRDPAHRARRAGPRPRAPLDRGRHARWDHRDRVRAWLGDGTSDEHARPPRGGRAMRPLHPQLPKGARVYLPDEAARKRHVEARLLDVFTRWGYREIVTSTFEYADVLAMGTDEGVQENMFKLVDRETGRMLALRADITPQIARIVATRLRDEPKPIRLGYVTNVFRYDEPQVSHYREFYQAGVELIGLEKPEAEVEIIAMAIEGLRALGLERFQIDLGHPDFFRGLCEETGAEPARVRELRAALARKDASALERLVSDSTPDAHVREALLALPTLFGHEAVLDRAAGLARNKRSAKALANLAEVYRLLTIYGLADVVLLDLGEVRGFDYYSGTYFEAYVSGFGASVAAGGRYDHMLARFGYDCAAVGFAFDVARVLSVMETQGVAVELPGPDFFIIDFTRDKTAALSLARRLRDLGASVARDIISRALEESVAYARARHVRHVLIVGSPLTGSHQLLAMDLADGSERVLAVAELLAEPGRFFTEIGHA